MEESRPRQPAGRFEQQRREDAKNQSLMRDLTGWISWRLRAFVVHPLFRSIHLRPGLAHRFHPGMTRVPVPWTAWIPAGIWMALIFAGSTDLLSTSQTSRFLEPFLRWLVPDLSAATLGTIQFLLRKAGHAFEYAVLALLTWWALTSVAGDFVRWSPRRAWLAWGLAAVYALSDEFHQSFVPSREARVRDVIIDAAGAALAILLLRLWFYGRTRRPAAAR